MSKAKQGEGVYRTQDNPHDKLPYFGPGWYHLSTPKDQHFIGHHDVADYYIFDFGTKGNGKANYQGHDTTDVFEMGLDNWVELHTSAPAKGGAGLYLIEHEHGYPFVETYHWSLWSYGVPPSTDYQHLKDLGTWTRLALDYQHWPYGGV